MEAHCPACAQDVLLNGVMMTPHRHGDRMLDELQMLLQLATAHAQERFTPAVPVRRVALRLDPTALDHLLVMVVLHTGQRYEFRIRIGQRTIEWCEIPNCNCMGFARLQSRFEVGASLLADVASGGQ